MGIIELRAQVRAAASDKSISSAESSALQAGGLTADQIARLRTNSKDGGGLSEGELMEIVHSTNTTVAGSAPAPAAATTPAAKPKDSSGPAADATAGAENTHGSLNQGTGVYQIDAESVYLRTHDGNGLVRGELRRGDSFEVHQVHDGVAYGYAPRQQKWGWIRLASGTPGVEGSGKANMHQVRELAAGTTVHHSTAFNEDIEYVHGGDERRTVGAYTFDATAKTTSAPLYANVVGGEGRDQIATNFEHYKRIGVRYAYDKDWYVVLATGADGNAHWGFMRKDDLVEKPDAKYQRWLDEHPNFRG